MATTRNVQLQATLVDSSGAPIAGESFSFQYKLSSTTSFTSAGTATTDASGNASVIVTLAAPNTYDASATFSGDTNYDASSGLVAGFRVKAATSTALVLVPQ